jgi:hypothetical protein
MAISRHNFEIDFADFFVELLKDVDSFDRYLYEVKTEGAHLDRCRKVIEELGL